MPPMTIRRAARALRYRCRIRHLATGFRFMISAARFFAIVLIATAMMFGFPGSSSFANEEPLSRFLLLEDTSVELESRQPESAQPESRTPAEPSPPMQFDFEAFERRLTDLESERAAAVAAEALENAEKSKKSTIRVNGRVHLDNWNFLDSDPGINFLESGNFDQDPQDRWDFRRVRLELSGDVPDDMFWRLQIDFNNPEQAEMKDVYLGFADLPHNQALIIGNQKRPIGLDHLNSSRHNVFTERPLAVETFNEDARRLGACMHGVNDAESLNWSYGVFLLENVNQSGRIRGDFDEGGLYGRLSGSPLYNESTGGRQYWHWGLAGSVNQTDADGDSDQDDNSNEARFRTRPLARSSSRWFNTGRLPGAENYEQLAVESMLNLGPLQITSEYINTWVQRSPAEGFSGEDLHLHGGYIFFHYFLTGEFIPLDRASGTIERVIPNRNFHVSDHFRRGRDCGWGALGVGLRLDYLDLTDGDVAGGEGTSATAALNWYWTAYSKLQVNMVWGTIDDAGQDRANGNGFAPGFPGVEGDYTILGMRYMIDW